MYLVASRWHRHNVLYCHTIKIKTEKTRSVGIGSGVEPSHDCAALQRNRTLRNTFVHVSKSPAPNKTAKGDDHPGAFHARAMVHARPHPPTSPYSCHPATTRARAPCGSACYQSSKAAPFFFFRLAAEEPPRPTMQSWGGRAPSHLHCNPQEACCSTPRATRACSRVRISPSHPPPKPKPPALFFSRATCRGLPMPAHPPRAQVVLERALFQYNHWRCTPHERFSYRPAPPPR